jgi:hypothetical protein
MQLHEQWLRMRVDAEDYFLAGDGASKACTGHGSKFYVPMQLERIIQFA